MPGVTLGNVTELVKLDSDLKRLAKEVFPKAAASACNKAARSLRSTTQKELVAKTGVPSGVIGKRLHARLADARKDRLNSRVRGYQTKVSASYRGKDASGVATLRARVSGRGASLGRAKFPGAWKGRSKRYGRDFIGARTGKSRDTMYFPAVEMESLVKTSLEKNAVAANKMQQDELAAQVEKRLAKFALGAIR